ncbi:MAG: hypothetical protein Q3M24_02855 [Candidatus Electrothrix aestuarii]|uniref:Pre-toxin TG domain-containing protein n=1 Tax=Candidatus Electrothrix aestuarii TaxID=3062594 RepID=A0AAU8LXX3_9BACT|nr:hypothetical protein [Candidatus Electrothrix aestuarii]
MSDFKNIPLPLFMCKKVLHEISISSGLDAFLRDTKIKSYRSFQDLVSFYKENEERLGEVSNKFGKELVKSQAFPAIKFYLKKEFPDLFLIDEIEEVRDLNENFYSERGKYFEPKRQIPLLGLSNTEKYFPLISFDTYLEEFISQFIKDELSKQGVESNHPQFEKIQENAEKGGIELYKTKHTFLNLIWNFPVMSFVGRNESFDTAYEQIHEKSLQLTNNVGLFGYWLPFDNFEKRLFAGFEKTSTILATQNLRLEFLGGTSKEDTDFNLTDQQQVADTLADIQNKEDIKKAAYISLGLMDMASELYTDGEVELATKILEIAEELLPHIIDFLLHDGPFSGYVGLFEYVAGYTLPDREELKEPERTFTLIGALLEFMPIGFILSKLLVVFKKTKFGGALANILHGVLDHYLSALGPVLKSLGEKWWKSYPAIDKRLLKYRKEGFKWARKAKKKLNGAFADIPKIDGLPDPNHEKYKDALEEATGLLKEINLAEYYHKKGAKNIEFNKKLNDLGQEYNTEIDLTFEKDGKIIWVESKSKGSPPEVEQSVSQSVHMEAKGGDILRIETDEGVDPSLIEEIRLAVFEKNPNIQVEFKVN